jgi:adenylyltransferase/sulfurtransferase
VTLDTIASGSTDYVFFCGSATAPSLLGPEERVSPEEYREKHPLTNTRTKGDPEASHTVIDVRDKAQFGICNLENSINIPISNFLGSAPLSSADPEAHQLPSWLPSELASESTDPIYVVCRLGNDSQIAVKKMKDLGLDRNGQRYIGDIRGGFRAWREQVDPEWPEY